MTDIVAPDSDGSSARPGNRGQVLTPGSVTRGFLFADLRGYTAFTERHGAVEAAELLMRYRSIVRQIVARFGGAEIRTEGDSFYIAFPAVSHAVEAGLAIVSSANDEEGQAPRINVGVGIHAGETVETPEGYVGTPVNVAARVCALAGPNEVLVTDTVRALVSSVIPVRFERGVRRPLKGISERVVVYRVLPAGAAVQRIAPRRRAGRHVPVIAGLVVASLVVLAVVALSLRGWETASARPADSSATLAAAASGSGLAGSGLAGSGLAGSEVAASVPSSSVEATASIAPSIATYLTLPSGVALVPGTYRTRVFRPVTTFTVGSGWTTFGDSFGDGMYAFDLARDGVAGDRMTILWSDQTSTDGCIEHVTRTDLGGGTYGPGGPPVVLGSIPAVDHLIDRGLLGGGPWIAPAPDAAASPVIGNELGIPVDNGARIDVAVDRLPHCGSSQPRGLALFRRIRPPEGQPPSADWVYLPRGAAARILPLTMRFYNGDSPSGVLVAVIQAGDVGALESFIGDAQSFLQEMRVWNDFGTDPPG